MKKVMLSLLAVAVLLTAVSVIAAPNEELRVFNVPFQDADGNPLVNALVTYVAADTNEHGEQNHDVYKLERGQLYLFNQTPVFKNPIQLVADEPGDSFETRPPMVVTTLNDEGGTAWGASGMEVWADITVKNINFSTMDPNGGYNWANIIEVRAPGINIVLEGVHITFSGWGLINGTGNANLSITVDRSHLRNLTAPGNFWCPFFLEMGGAVIDKIVVRNTTFFNKIGSPVNSSSPKINHFEWDHNTHLNVFRLFSGIDQYSHAIVTNNIFYNSNMAGYLEEEVADAVDQVPKPAVVIDVDTLAANEPHASDSLKATKYMEEWERTYLLKNNVYYWSQDVMDMHDVLEDEGILTVRPHWMSSRARDLFDDEEVYYGFVDENNIHQDPEFTFFGGTDHFVELIYNNYTGGAAPVAGWNPDDPDFPNYDYAHLLVDWPLPEILTHNIDQLGTHGFPVGSLMWYPQHLQEYYNTIVSVPENNAVIVPKTFSLDQNYPNPFNPETNIQFTLNQPGKVTLKIYNTLGQVVRTVVDDAQMHTGLHTYSVDMSDLSSGIYLYVLENAGQRVSRKMTLLK